MSRHARPYSPDEIAALAARIQRLVEAEREIRITPATGWLVARAVRVFAARPTREQVMEAICGRNDCPERATCMRCMGKANLIMRLYDGDEDVLASMQTRCGEQIVCWEEVPAVRRSLDASLAIGAALSAGLPWLRVYCPGCRSIGEVDLRTVDRHHGASLASLITSLACRRCRGQGPLPQCMAWRASRSAEHGFGIGGNDSVRFCRNSGAIADIS
jgi:hypothetical protein